MNLNGTHRIGKIMMGFRPFVGDRIEVGDRVISKSMGNTGIVMSKKGYRFRIKLEDGREVSGFGGDLCKVKNQSV